MKNTIKKTPWKYISIFIIVAVFALFLDRIVKEFALVYLAKDTISVIENFFTLTLEYNRGVAFGIALPIYFQLILIPLLIILGIYYITKHLNIESTFVMVVTGLITGAAMSNFIDRVFYQHVIDYISIWLWPVFNIADVFITIGIFLLVLFYGKIKRV